VIAAGEATSIGCLELRRALLLFAIVLGVAAIVTSLSRPAKHRDDATSDPPRTGVGTPTVNPRPAREEPAVISFSASGKSRTRRLFVSRHATVMVEVARPGQVELAGLGLTSPAEPLTPARFDVFATRAGRYAVRFLPARSTEARTVGVLRVIPYGLP
jgi:hypothetical protein